MDALDRLKKQAQKGDTSAQIELCRELYRRGELANYLSHPGEGAWWMAGNVFSLMRFDLGGPRASSIPKRFLGLLGILRHHGWLYSLPREVIRDYVYYPTLGLSPREAYAESRAPSHRQTGRTTSRVLEALAQVEIEGKAHKPWKKPKPQFELFAQSLHRSEYLWTMLSRYSRVLSVPLSRVEIKRGVISPYGDITIRKGIRGNYWILVDHPVNPPLRKIG